MKSVLFKIPKRSFIIITANEEKGFMIYKLFFKNTLPRNAGQAFRLTPWPESQNACPKYLMCQSCARASRFSLSEETQQHAGGHCRSDHTRHIGPHGMHKQVVCRIIFESHVVGYAGCHRHRRHSGIADERIDLLAGLRSRLKSFPDRTPVLDAIMKAAKPSPNISRVSVLRNLSAWVDAPTVRPSRMVTISVMALLAVLARRVVTPLSLSRLPKKSMPSSGMPEGTTKQVR